MTLTEKPTDTFAVCPVCYWEDDGLQYSAADSFDGANSVSLNEARANFLKFGASRRDARRKVRAPLESEVPKPKKTAASEDTNTDTDTGETQ